jgi:hypothetical protein
MRLLVGTALGLLQRHSVKNYWSFFKYGFCVALYLKAVNLKLSDNICLIVLFDCIQFEKHIFGN